MGLVYAGAVYGMTGDIGKETRASFEFDIKELCTNVPVMFDCRIKISKL